MSKRYILNDREVVFNEDVQGNDEWNSRDLSRVLQALQSGTYVGASAGPAASLQGGSILAGLEVLPSLTSLRVSVNPGAAMFRFPSVDPGVSGPFQSATSEDATVLNLPVAPVTEYRWDLIEVSATKTTVTALRQVLNFVGTLRTLVPTTLPKVEENQLQIRIRSGAPNTDRESALIPQLSLSEEWLPIAAVEVTPSALVTDGLRFLDLRKLFGRIKYSESTRNGVNQGLSMHSDLFLVVGNSDWVTTGGYMSPISPVFGESNVRMRVDPNSVYSLEAGLTILPDIWYYLYAYRPSRESGYTSVLVSSVPPESSSATIQAGVPNVAISLPPPFSTPGYIPPSHYLGATKFYIDGAAVYPRPFRKQGNFTAISGESTGGYAGATFENKLHPGGGGLIAPGSVFAVTVNPDADGLTSVPPGTKMVKIQAQFENLSTSISDLSFEIRSGGFTYYKVANVSPGAVVCPSFDLPILNVATTQFQLRATGSVLADVGAYRLWVVGYYEEFS